jgi:peptidylprolyl isomerase
MMIVAGLTAGLALLGACSNDTQSGKPSSSSSPTSTASGSASASPSASPTATVKPADNLNGLKVTGAFGKDPKLSFKHPWAISKTQSKVLQSGKGAQVLDDGDITVNYTGWNGRTGKAFDSSFSRGTPVTFSLSGVIPGFKKGLVGKHVGDRVLIAMTGKDGYDSSGGNAQAGIKTGDSLIFVADITATTLKSAEGKEAKPKAGLPSVSMSGDKPSVTIPKTDPPAKTTVEALIQGRGATVKSGDTVTTRSVTLLWKDGKVVDDSWGQRWTPQATDPTTGQAGPQRLTAMQNAMVGHTVGSRLVMVFPPGTAYKNGDRSQGIAKDDTVVMVVDILFTQAAQ